MIDSTFCPMAKTKGAFCLSVFIKIISGTYLYLCYNVIDVLVKLKCEWE